MGSANSCSLTFLLLKNSLLNFQKPRKIPFNTDTKTDSSNCKGFPRKRGFRSGKHLPLPKELAFRRLNSHVVNAGKAAFHITELVKFPQLVLIRSVPLAGLIVKRGSVTRIVAFSLPLSASLRLCASLFLSLRSILFILSNSLLGS